MNYRISFQIFKRYLVSLSVLIRNESKIEVLPDKSLSTSWVHVLQEVLNTAIQPLLYMFLMLNLHQHKEHTQTPHRRQHYSNPEYSEFRTKRFICFSVFKKERVIVWKVFCCKMLVDQVKPGAFRYTAADSSPSTNLGLVLETWL